MHPSRLALADGSVFSGVGFGAVGTGVMNLGEVVFNTSMSGYQEALTDPSYTGQILALTATQVGNYGITIDDIESARPTVSGFVVRELSRVWSNQRSVEDLSGWLAKFDVPGIHEIDTRALVRKLRNSGSMNGVLCGDATRSDDELVALAKSIATTVNVLRATRMQLSVRGAQSPSDSSHRNACRGLTALARS